MASCFDGLDTSGVPILADLERLVRSIQGDSVKAFHWMRANEATMRQLDSLISQAGLTFAMIENGKLHKKSPTSNIDPSCFNAPPIRVGDTIYCPGDRQYGIKISDPDVFVVGSIGLAMKAEGVSLNHEDLLQGILIGEDSWWWAMMTWACILIGILPSVNFEAFAHGGMFSSLIKTFLVFACIIGGFGYFMAAAKLSFNCFELKRSWKRYAYAIPLSAGFSMADKDTNCLPTVSSIIGWKTGRYVFIFAFFIWLSFVLKGAVVFTLCALVVFAVLFLRSAKESLKARKTIKSLAYFLPYWEASLVAQTPSRLEQWLSALEDSDRKNVLSLGLLVSLSSKLGVIKYERHKVLKSLTSKDLVLGAVRY